MSGYEGPVGSVLLIEFILRMNWDRTAIDQGKVHVEDKG
jgi:hypothetical protein